MARPVWIPVDACSDSAQVPAIPAATTVPPRPSPKARSAFAFPASALPSPSCSDSASDSASVTRFAYAPNSTAMKSAAAPSSSSRETSAAPVLVSSTSDSPPRSNMSPSLPDPVYGVLSRRRTSVAAVSVTQPPTTSRCNGRTEAPRCQQARTNAAPPTSRMNPAYEM